MSGTILPLPQYAFMAWCLVKTRTNLPFADKGSSNKTQTTQIQMTKPQTNIFSKYCAVNMTQSIYTLYKVHIPTVGKKKAFAHIMGHFVKVASI
jgi:hypothetical protein